MTSNRDRVKLSPAEVRVFLAEQRTVVVASRLPDDTTHLSALWYALDGEDLVFWTYASAQKTKNMERDPRVTALVEVGQSYDELRGVMIIGHGTSTQREPRRLLELGQLLAAPGTRRACFTPEDISDVGRKRAAIRIQGRVGSSPGITPNWQGATEKGLGRVAAVDGQCLACDPTGLRGQQEHCCVGDVLHRAETRQRNVPSGVSQKRRGVVASGDEFVPHPFALEAGRPRCSSL